jgi:sterol desaturase/sphingolipid hydroxylase (fatty acid hydroxylase superfamily)
MQPVDRGDMPISNDASLKSKPAETSIRLFRNDFMEALTHVHPIVPLLFWSPVAAWLLWRSIALHELPATGLVLIALCGLVVWSLSEYLLHRFVFHYQATGRIGKYLVFMFHGVHHAAPRDKTRLVMPPAGAVIVMLGLWQMFRLVVPAPWIEPFCAFFIIGYLVYDYFHYSTHHFPMKHPLLHFLKVYHLRHHYGSYGKRFGVSSPLWDRVFGTYPDAEPLSAPDS